MTKRAPVQIDFNSTPIGKIYYACIPWVEHLEIFDKHYAPRCGTDQSAERLAKRGGFGVKEAAELGYNPLVFWFSEIELPKSDEEWKKCAIRFNNNNTYNYYILTEEEYRGLDIFDKVKDNYNLL